MVVRVTRACNTWPRLGIVKMVLGVGWFAFAESWKAPRISKVEPMPLLRCQRINGCPLSISIIIVELRTVLAPLPRSPANNIIRLSLSRIVGLCMWMRRRSCGWKRHSISPCVTGWSSQMQEARHGRAWHGINWNFIWSIDEMIAPLRTQLAGTHQLRWDWLHRGLIQECQCWRVKGKGGGVSCEADGGRARHMVVVTPRSSMWRSLNDRARVNNWPGDPVHANSRILIPETDDHFTSKTNVRVRVNVAYWVEGT